MVNGCSNIFVEKGNQTVKVNRNFESPERLEKVIQRLAANIGREMNDLNPIVDARLSDGSRINAVHSNIAMGGPVLTIRKFMRRKMGMAELIAQGDICTLLRKVFWTKSV